MNKALSLSLVIILYGALFFNAINYFFQITHPSWGIWLFLYVLAAWVVVKNINRLKLKIYTYDLCFIAFIAYVIFSFVVFGDSAYQDFLFRIVFICVAPYLLGRILGWCVGLSLYESLKMLSAIYVMLILFGVLNNPSLFSDIDRIRLFSDQNHDRIGTVQIIGLSMGSMWLAIYAYLTAPIKTSRMPDKKNIILKLSMIIIPVFILTVGSRSSIAAMLGGGVVLALASLVCKEKKPGGFNKGISIMFLVVFMGLFLFQYLPDSRKELLFQIYESIAQKHYNTEICQVDVGQSLINRMGLISEAFRLFLGSPILGIGASNYGWQYCGLKADFVSPHSIFVQVLAELGIIGFSLFSLFHILIIKKFFYNMKSRTHTNHMLHWVLFSLWVFIVIQVQITGNMYYDYQFFLLTGLLVSNLLKCTPESNGGNDLVYIVRSVVKKY